MSELMVICPKSGNCKLKNNGFIGAHCTPHKATAACAIGLDSWDYCPPCVPVDEQADKPKTCKGTDKRNMRARAGRGGKQMSVQQIYQNERLVRDRLDSLIRQVWCALRDLSDYRDGAALTNADIELMCRITPHPAIQRVLDLAFDPVNNTKPASQPAPGGEGET